MSVIITLLLLTFLLFFFEIFAPGGLLALLGILALLAASAVAFTDFGLFPAIAVFTGGAVAGIVLFFIEIKLLQKTALGNQLSLQSTISGQSAPVASSMENLVGKEGVTLTRLTPSGKVRIDGREHVARSQGGFLDAGTPVRVVRSEVFNLIVEQS
jgi:membrane-bound serine protease (ClpP class)